MKRYFLFSLLIAFVFSCSDTNTTQDTRNKSSHNGQEKPFAIVIHGGAGGITPDRFTPEQEQAYSYKLREALDIGYAELERGGTALDAVQMAITVLENSPLFNAGKGAVFNSLGQQEMDASIMDGKSLKAGAVPDCDGCKIRYWQPAQ